MNPFFICFPDACNYSIKISNNLFRFDNKTGKHEKNYSENNNTYTFSFFYL